MKRTCISPFLLIALFVLTASAAWAGSAKVQVCHIPPGNPANFHTITISENALQAHLGHGDLAGACFAHCDTLCSDGNACTIDACDASERCVSTHPPVNCDDGSFCTIDSCNPASGCASVPKTCADGNNCTVDACDPLTGSCVAPPVACPDGQSCNPANGECASIDFCAVEPCANGDCMNGATGYTCLCFPGWTGPTCEVPYVDPCAGVVCPDNCHFDGVCRDGVCTQGTPFPDGMTCRGGRPLADRCVEGVCYTY
jgi:Dictyostelium (slime mold) repeat/EGF-like domain